MNCTSRPLLIRDQRIFVIILLLFVITISGCNTEGREERQAIYDSYMKRLKYNLLEPEQVFELPASELEISGLTMYNGKNLLYLDDEKGEICQFYPDSGKAANRVRFWKNDDYEGIEQVGDYIYALKSNGNLIRFKFNGTETKESVEIKTGLSTANDTEGLGYDSNTGNLLIACKESGSIDSQVPGRVVYAFDPSENLLKRKPVIQVRWVQINEYLKENKLNFLRLESKLFKPSAVAVNPVDNNIYVLSSTGKSMIVFNRNGKLLLYYSVPRKVLEKPEGICFDKTGNLYLSSEGEIENPRIIKFKMRP